MSENMNIGVDESMADVSSEPNDLDTLPSSVAEPGKQSDVDNVDVDVDVDVDVVDVDDDDDDDGSTITIGEIDVDEYFDDIFCDQQRVVPEESPAVLVDQNEQGCSSRADHATDDPDASILSNLFKHTSVATRNDNLAAGRGNISHPSRSAAFMANVNFAFGRAKRKHPFEEDREQSLKFRLIERQVSMNQKNALLKDFGIVVPAVFYQIFLQDKHFLLDEDFILKLPATPTVYEILTAYSENKSVNPDVLEVVLEAFDVALPKWCLYRVEQLQHKNIIGKFPALRMSKIYGLSHFIRFISYLPKLFNELNKYRDTFVKNVSVFTSGFLNYMVEANINIDFDRDYDNVIPNYNNMKYRRKPTKRHSAP